MTGLAGLAAALGADTASMTCLVGTGGKTSAMQAIAAELAAADRRVITTTSTHILGPTDVSQDPPGLVVDPSIERIIARLRATPWTHVTVAAEREPGGHKLVGHPPAALDRLAASGLADHLLVEADGAAGRPLKAHNPTEPVVPSRCDRIVAVVGLGGLGRPLDGRTVHRRSIAVRITDAAPGSPITPGWIARLLCGPGGWFDLLPSQVPVAVLLCGAGGAEPDRATDLASRLVATGRPDRVVVAELRGRQRFARSV